LTLIVKEVVKLHHVCTRDRNFLNSAFRCNKMTAPQLHAKKLFRCQHCVFFILNRRLSLNDKQGCGAWFSDSIIVVILKW